MTEVNTKNCAVDCVFDSIFQCVPAVFHVHLLRRHHRHHSVLQFLPVELLDALSSRYLGRGGTTAVALYLPLQVRVAG